MLDNMALLSLLYFLIMISPIVLIIFFLYKMAGYLKQLVATLDRIESKLDRQ